MGDEVFRLFRDLFEFQKETQQRLEEIEKKLEIIGKFTDFADAFEAFEEAESD